MIRLRPKITRLENPNVPAEVVRNLRQILEHRYPKECCGLIAGDCNREIAKVFEMPNISTNRNEFYVKRGDFIRVGEEILRSGYGITGVFHSHPTGPLLPSVTDIEGMTFSGIMLIVGRWSMEAFRVHTDCECLD